MSRVLRGRFRVFRVGRLQPFREEVDLALVVDNGAGVEAGHRGIDNAELIRLKFLGKHLVGRTRYFP